MSLLPTPPDYRRLCWRDDDQIHGAEYETSQRHRQESGDQMYFGGKPCMTSVSKYITLHNWQCKCNNEIPAYRNFDGPRTELQIYVRNPTGTLQFFWWICDGLHFWIWDAHATATILSTFIVGLHYVWTLYQIICSSELQRMSDKLVQVHMSHCLNDFNKKLRTKDEHIIGL
jgi:hypothetical protein